MYRAIPKAPKHKYVLTESELQNKQLETEQKTAENFPIENNNGVLLNNQEQDSESDESISSQQNDNEKEIKKPQLVKFKNSLKDTLYVEADVLEQGEQCVKLQRVVNVGTSLMFILFYFSLIFIGFGIYNIYRYNNLPYVTQETDIIMQQRIKNFYTTLLVYLCLILLIIALILIVG